MHVLQDSMWREIFKKLVFRVTKQCLIVPFLRDLCQSKLCCRCSAAYNKIISNNAAKPNKRLYLVMVTGNHDVSSPRFPGFVAETSSSRTERQLVDKAFAPCPSKRSTWSDDIIQSKSMHIHSTPSDRCKPNASNICYWIGSFDEALFSLEKNLAFGFCNTFICIL